MSDPRLEAIRQRLDTRPNDDPWEEARASRQDCQALLALIDTLQRERDEAVKKAEIYEQGYDDMTQTAGNLIRRRKLRRLRSPDSPKR